MIMHSESLIHHPGAVYHVKLRGKGGQDIFFHDNDGHYFCLLLEEGKKRFGFRLYAFCLMPNHVHLAIRVGDISCARIMSDIGLQYTQYANSMYKKTGPLFQRRHKAVLIDDKKYLLELVRHIHLNPVRAGIVETPEEYPWSSHNAYMGDEAMSWLPTGWVLSRYSALENMARQRYKDFISEGMKEGFRPEFHKGNRPDGILGDDFFAKSALQKAHEAQERLLSLDETIEYVCGLCGVDPKTLGEMDKKLDRSEVRAILALIVQDQDHLSIAELSKRLNRNVTNLLRATKRLLSSMEYDPTVAEKVEMIQNQLGRIQAGPPPSPSSMKRQLSMEEIIEHVAGLYSVDPTTLAESSRRPEVQEARAMAAMIVSDQDHLSVTDLSRRLNRHPSSMGHVILRLRKRVKNSPSLAQRVEIVRSRIAEIHAGQAPSVPSTPPILTFDRIIEEVCKLYGLSPDGLAGPSREPSLREARAIAGLIVQDQDHLSMTALGRRLNRTVCTMAGLVDRLVVSIQTNPELAVKLNTVGECLGLPELSEASARVSRGEPYRKRRGRPTEAKDVPVQDVSYEAPKGKKGRPTLGDILEKVSMRHNLTPTDLAESVYRRKPGDARAIAGFIVLHQDHLSFTELGRRFNRYPGNLRDTARLMLKRVQKDYSLAEHVNMVAQELGLADAFHLPILSSPPQLLSMDEIIETVCNLYSCPPAVMAKIDQRTEFLEARAMVALMVSEQDHLSLAALDRRLNRARGSMNHLVMRLLKRLDKDPALAERSEIVRTQVAVIQPGQGSVVPSTTLVMSYDEIIEEVCTLYGFSPAVMPRRDTEPKRLEARAIATLIVQDYDHLSRSEMSRRLNRSKDTMAEAEQKLRKRMETNPELAARVSTVRARLRRTESGKMASPPSSHLSPPEKPAEQRPRDVISDKIGEQRRAKPRRRKVEDRAIKEDILAKVAPKKADKTIERRIYLDEIIECVSELYGVAPAVLAVPGAKRKPAEARSMIALLVLEQPHLSINALGKRLNRYPADLRQVAKRLRKRVKTNPSLAEQVEMVKTRLRQLEEG